MNPFMSQMTFSTIFWVECCSWIFFFTRECFTLQRIVFPQSRCSSLTVSYFINIFWLKQLLCKHNAFLYKLHIVRTSQFLFHSEQNKTKRNKLSRLSFDYNIFSQLLRLYKRATSSYSYEIICVLDIWWDWFVIWGWQSWNKFIIA